jgi:hypothetical protein
MSRLRRAAAALLIALCGVSAQAQAPSRSLDSVARGEAKSLDSAAKGRSVDLDAAGSGGGPATLDAVTAASPAPPAPVPLPEIEDEAMRALAQGARDAVVAAQQRAEKAKAAYSKMRARNYPQGDARAAIVQERDSARQAHQQASARYAEILKQLQ